MTKLRPLSIASLLVIGVTLQACTQAETGVRHGFAADRLARIEPWMQQYVDSNRIGGAVLLVMRDGDVVYEKAVGWADKEANRRMTPDALFRIASQTKALTSVAIMMLVEEGRVMLNDPVARFIPAFATTTVIGPPAGGGRAATTVPALRAITIKDLLTHTAGIPYGTDQVLGPIWAAKGLGPATGPGFYLSDKDEPVCTTMETLATLPFGRQPGEGFVYGWGTDVLGCVVERASGMSLADFIRTRITEPLGMDDTYFYVPLEKRGRLVTVYASDQNRYTVRAPEGQWGQGHYVVGPRKSYSGGAGLVSTARDYARFSRMLLNGGVLDGQRLLSPAVVKLMTTNQIDTLYSMRGGGYGFGLGFEIAHMPSNDLALASPGTFGWGGAYGSFYRIDPVKRVVVIFMMNQIPNRTNIRDRVMTMVYQAIVE